ncbi:MAG: PPC domain-containing protein [Spirochaetaceae bacterium]|nr:PPC domain-containing protein [Spirochaetaceae bacterium]
MKKTILLLAFALSVSFLSADELMENLKNASDQVAQDLSLFMEEDNLYAGAFTFENRPVLMGDLFSDLLANRLLNNSRFKGNIVKGYSPGTFRISDAQWVLSGSLYKTGSNYFLSLYLNDSTGQQKKGWEFLIPADGTDSLLEPSRIAISSGGDIYEPNDSSSTAVELKPEPALELDNLEIGESGDEDWFYVDVNELGSGSTMYILSVQTLGGMDTYLEVFSPGDTSYPITENDDGDDGNARINFALTETGRWYIKVRGYSSDETGDYGLSVALEMREAGPGEPDNTMDQATVLEIEGEEIRRTMDYGDDYDYFRITLDRPLGENKALVIQTYSDLDLSMTLLDQYDNEITTNDDSGLDSNPQIMLPAQEEGTWYAVVYPYDGDNTGRYTIKAYLVDIVKDDYENDNSMEEASSIEINGPAQERTFMPANEEDWIRLVVEEPGEFIIKTTGPIDTYITLYDRYGEYIYEDDDGGNDNNALISERLDEGVYYIQVTQYEGDGNVEDNYYLSVRRY